MRVSRDSRVVVEDEHPDEDMRRRVGTVRNFSGTRVVIDFGSFYGTVELEFLRQLRTTDSLRVAG